MLIITEGHAFAAVSLANGLREWNNIRPERALFETEPLRDTEQGATYISKWIDEGSWLAVECTGFAYSEVISAVGSEAPPESIGREKGLMTFKLATAAGQAQLDYLPRPFKFAFDIAVAHYYWRIQPYELPLPDDVAAVNTGLNLVRDQIAKNQASRDAACRSKEKIKDTACQIGEMKFFKNIHDALHEIEDGCLRPMETMNATSRLRPYKLTFDEESCRIQEAVKGREMTPLLEELLEQLHLITVDFQAAVNVPGNDAFDRVTVGINVLLSSFLARFDDKITEAAKMLNLDRLVELMTTVRDNLSAAAANHDIEFQKFLEGIDALNRLRDELIRRVSEHNSLQTLDYKLRTTCVAKTNLLDIATAWKNIKRARSKLTPPFSNELDAANADLVAMEREIDETIERNEETRTVDLLKEYFRSMSRVFLTVDRGLKEFCMRLSDVNQPLQIVLSMC